MPLSVTPYVPQFITVHIGAPDSPGEDVMVSFPDYVKNVASSEIYPTWEPAAIRANVLAIVSFALNRVYTEFYRSRGYPFEITSSTAYDQKFIPGRNIFENISQVVDETFTSYIRRQGFVEPLSAKFCNGTTTTCDGLSQWGSQRLAQQGYNSIDILRHYYGDNIEVVTDAPVRGIQDSYPGYPLRPGSVGPNVTIIQASLNRISRDYPAIPEISPVDGIFDENTERAVKKFQSIFNLTPDGVVGKATWYKLVYLTVGIQRLAELVSQGQKYYTVNFGTTPTPTLRLGDSGRYVELLQYWLALAAQFNNAIPALTLDGVFGPKTEQAVRAFQQWAGLEPDGVAGPQTWDYLYRAYQGIFAALLQGRQIQPITRQYPGSTLQMGSRDA